jgi:hypothetical protein
VSRLTTRSREPTICPPPSAAEAARRLCVERAICEVFLRSSCRSLLPSRETNLSDSPRER